MEFLFYFSSQINLFQTYSMRLQNGIPNGTRYNDGVFDETDKVNVINAALARYPSSFQLSVELLKNHMNTPTAAIQQTIAKMQSQIPDETEDTMLDNILLVLGCDAKHMPPLLNTYINSSPKRAARYLSYINLNGKYNHDLKSNLKNLMQSSQINRWNCSSTENTSENESPGFVQRFENNGSNRIQVFESKCFK